MAETPEQLLERLRSLEQLSQRMGLVLQNQLGNNGEKDPQAAMAKKLATLKPPIFVGKEWLRDFDNLFTATGTPEAQKVDQATFYLREDADTWWESQGPIVRAQENFNWNAFKEYAQKFNELARFCPNVVPDERPRLKSLRMNNNNRPYNNNNSQGQTSNAQGGNTTQHNGQNNNRANGGNNNQNINGNGARGNNGRIYVMNQNEADTKPML
ncbi:uncharacterized protein LOC130591386 [Beta vulgaris subsp. vulgaris]|uniref:uncharacterized protein LOC130591386 n=1 Tax=Beta vulgaris subsp. vulgaris TaxID=3555 RepID=UPI0025468818|nr:uncharacterized protein LOC130591386 [Beta vulgaris subsp. vulgaris]